MNLKAWRNRKNLSIAQLSARSSVPIRTIEDIERRGSCQIGTAQKLADALEVNLYDLVSKELYAGKYWAVPLDQVLLCLEEVMHKDDYVKMLHDMYTYKDGIHIQAMNKAYKLYEDLLEKGRANVNFKWEKTLHRS